MEVHFFYQACSKCTAIDLPDELGLGGEPCSWETARYEIAFDADTQQFGCDENATGVCGMAQCQETGIYFALFLP